jgi:hypothetical protein
MGAKTKYTRSAEIRGGTRPSVPPERREALIEAVRHEATYRDIMTTFDLQERTARNWQKWAREQIAEETNEQAEEGQTGDAGADTLAN